VSDIFISYASADHDRIFPLVKALEKMAWSVFWDRTIPTGKTWREILEAEIQECRSVIVIWTENSVKSEWVHEEAEAGKGRKILIPVLLDRVVPPFGFRGPQAANLVNWNGDTSSADFIRLSADIATILGPSPVPLAASGEHAGFDRGVHRKSNTDTQPAGGTPDRKFIDEKSEGIGVMKNDKESARSAQMAASKTILTAIIAGVAGVIVALIATGNLFPRLVRNESLAPKGGNVPAVLNAPHLSFRSAAVDPSLENCMQKAMNGLRSAGLTGLDKKEYFAWGHRQQTTGLIWCHIDQKLVIFLAAGLDSAEADQTAEALRRSF
jgi:TIR domain